MSFEFDEEYRKLGYTFLVGTDEAGRGPLAGPVVAAAVILPPTFRNDDIDDSKKLTDKKRRELFKIITDNALSYRIVFISAPLIDEINIYEASRLAMCEAIKQLDIEFDAVLTDAMKIPEISLNYPLFSLIKGDAKSLTIASASILAKVSRDDYMLELDKKYPQYKFISNKGYGTKVHLEALKCCGIIKGEHRETFAPVRDVIKN